MSSSRDQLIQRLRNQEARLGVNGLGYVGLLLALEFAKAGFVTVGVDLDGDKVGWISAGDPCGIDVSRAEVAAMAASGTRTATTDFSRLRALGCLNICVPTPLRKTKDSDPHVPSVNRADLELTAVSPDAALDRGFDCGVITTQHPEFDYPAIAERSTCLVDTRNALKGLFGSHIHRLSRRVSPLISSRLRYPFIDYVQTRHH